LDEKMRPGLVAHWQAIEYCLASGLQSYDFLAGDNRYKRSLSSREYMQYWVYLQRPRLKLRTEQLARRLKYYVRRSS
jgi:CelD/BcsL family acetyltransferase involved in cellulose biosynthesis